MSLLEDVQDEVAAHLDDISKLFKPGAKVTILIRAGNDPNGLKDFMMSDDEPQEIMNMIARCIARGKDTERKSDG